MKSGWFKKRSTTERAAIIAGILGIIGTVLAVVISNVLQPPTIIIQPPTGPTVQPPTEPTAQPPSTSELHLVDVGFIESDEFPKLDIKLRNTGEKVAFLKRADFKVEKIWELCWPDIPPIMAPVKISENYSVMLPISRTPYYVSESVSQSIKRDAVDRFTFTLGTDAALDESVHYVFLITVELIYDEDDKSLTSPNLLFTQISWNLLFALTHIDLDIYAGQDSKEGIITQNKQLVEEINEINGIKSNRLKELLRVISEISIED